MKQLYNGNSYTEEWEKEAKKRGLKNVKKAPEAFKAFVTNDSIKMFDKVDYSVGLNYGKSKKKYLVELIWVGKS